MKRADTPLKVAAMSHTIRPACSRRLRGALLMAIALMVSIAPSLSAKEKATVIKGGDLYTITSGVIRNGMILIEDGKIAAIGEDLDVPKDANIVDASGKIVMPGFVAASTRSMPAAGYRSDKIAESLDPFHYTVSLALASGVTSIFASGSGPSSRAPLGGTNAVIKPTYGDLENMLVKEPVVENLNIGSGRWTQRTDFIAKMREARAYLQKLAHYERSGKKGDAPKKPSGIDPYLRLLRREIAGHVSADDASEMLPLLELVDEFGFELIIEGGVEAWTIAEEIGAQDVTLIITPRAKQRPNERVSRPSGSNLENAAILKKAGVKFAIIPATSYFSTGGIAGRDLMTFPLEAAFAVSGGLDEETALKAITITAAEILGIDDRVGSLQVGKDADIVILDGHPFHYNTFVEQTFVNGKRLYEKSESPFFSHVTHYDDEMPGLFPEPPEPPDVNDLESEPDVSLLYH